MSLELELPNRRSTKKLAQALAATLGAGDLVVLSGPLGAGKTFLVRALLHALGLPAGEPVTSPTFALVNEYALGIPVVHADLYRLDDDADVEELGLRDVRRRGATLLVEWGERFVDTLGGDALVVTITLAAGAPRRARLSATGPRGEDVARTAHVAFGRFAAPPRQPARNGP